MFAQAVGLREVKGTIFAPIVVKVRQAFFNLNFNM